MPPQAVPPQNDQSNVTMPLELVQQLFASLGHNLRAHTVANQPPNNLLALPSSTGNATNRASGATTSATSGNPPAMTRK